MLSVPKGRTSQSRLPQEERKSCSPTINSYHPHSKPRYPEEDDGKGTYGPHPKPHGLVKRQRKDRVLQRGRTRGFLIQRTGLTSVSPLLNIHAVTTHITANTISLPIEIKKNEYESVKTLALIDSGARGKFINQKYAEQLGLPIQTLKRPIMARNVDGTLNKTGTITSYVDLTVKIDGQIMDIQLLVMGLGYKRIILRFPWLNECNLDINWKTGEFKWRNL